MNNVIRAIKKIKEEKPTVYQGKGNFAELTVTLNQGMNVDAIKSVADKHEIVLPDEYVVLLSFSNGISFFEHGDCKFYSLEDALSVGIDEWMREGYVCVARYYEDSIYLQCDNNERNVFISEEGFSKLRSMKMSLGAFLDASLCSGFSYFWLW